MAKPLPSAEYLHERLTYDPRTGVLLWKAHPGASTRWASRYAGARAGSVSASDGYRYVCIDGVDYCAHRIAVKMVLGRDPQNEVDHRNGHRDDNRWRNLREATMEQNRRNMRAKVRESGLPKGVYYHVCRQKFVAQIKVRGKVKYLGIYATPQRAHEAYAAASREHHGEFGRTA